MGWDRWMDGWMVVVRRKEKEGDGKKRSSTPCDGRVACRVCALSVCLSACLLFCSVCLQCVFDSIVAVLSSLSVWPGTRTALCPCSLWLFLCFLLFTPLLFIARPLTGWLFQSSPLAVRVSTLPAECMNPAMIVIAPLPHRIQSWRCPLFLSSAGAISPMAQKRPFCGFTSCFSVTSCSWTATRQWMAGVASTLSKGRALKGSRCLQSLQRNEGR